MAGMRKSKSFQAIRPISLSAHSQEISAPVASGSIDIPDARMSRDFKDMSKVVQSLAIPSIFPSGLCNRFKGMTDSPHQLNADEAEKIGRRIPDN